MGANLKHIEIKGLRGFANEGHIGLGLPNGELGSGLTILIGPNNGGKSTVVEAFKAISKPQPSSFTEGKRNKKAGDSISIRLINTRDETKELKTINAGGSETEWKNLDIEPKCQEIFVVPSRRTFNPFFGKDTMDRESYITQFEIPAIRVRELDNFFRRIFKIQQNKESFDRLLRRILQPLPDWKIEQADSGSYYLKFEYSGQFHNSDGLGEGLISIFFIIDAFYDSKPNNIIVIDEPELSLHPSLQNKLANFISEYAKDRQIILATHSPYFIDWTWIMNGAKVARIKREQEGSTINQLSEAINKNIRGLINNLNNPHILGLDAKSVFFLEDNVILVEGQEDVVFYKLIEKEIGINLSGQFYGWGVGGAENMATIAEILSDLGFKKVIGILDKNKEAVGKKLRAEFEKYRFYIIPTENIRTRKDTPAKKGVEGIIDNYGNVNKVYLDEIKKIFSGINSELLGK